MPNIVAKNGKSEFAESDNRLDQQKLQCKLQSNGELYVKNKSMFKAYNSGYILGLIFQFYIFFAI